MEKYYMFNGEKQQVVVNLLDDKVLISIQVSFNPFNPCQRQYERIDTAAPVIAYMLKEILKNDDITKYQVSSILKSMIEKNLHIYSLFYITFLIDTSVFNTSIVYTQLGVLQTHFDFEGKKYPTAIIDHTDEQKLLIYRPLRFERQDIIDAATPAVTELLKERYKVQDITTDEVHRFLNNHPNDFRIPNHIIIILNDDIRRILA